MKSFVFLLSLAFSFSARAALPANWYDLAWYGDFSFNVGSAKATITSDSLKMTLADGHSWEVKTKSNPAFGKYHGTCDTAFLIENKDLILACKEDGHNPFKFGFYNVDWNTGKILKSYIALHNVNEVKVVPVDDTHVLLLDDVYELNSGYVYPRVTSVDLITQSILWEQGFGGEYESVDLSYVTSHSAALYLGNSKKFLIKTFNAEKGLVGTLSEKQFAQAPGCLRSVRFFDSNVLLDFGAVRDASGHWKCTSKYYSDPRPVVENSWYQMTAVNLLDNHALWNSGKKSGLVQIDYFPEDASAAYVALKNKDQLAVQKIDLKSGLLVWQNIFTDDRDRAYFFLSNYDVVDQESFRLTEFSSITEPDGFGDRGYGNLRNTVIERKSGQVLSVKTCTYYAAEKCITP